MQNIMTGTRSSQFLWWRAAGARLRSRNDDDGIQGQGTQLVVGIKNDIIIIIIRGRLLYNCYSRGHAHKREFTFSLHPLLNSGTGINLYIPINLVTYTHGLNIQVLFTHSSRVYRRKIFKIYTVGVYTYYNILHQLFA